MKPVDFFVMGRYGLGLV